MIEPLGNAQPQAAASANSTSQRIDTATGDQSQPRSDLNRDQSAIEIGASIPIVFCKRIGDLGGVWLDPPAVEARLENSTNNEVTVWYRLVLSDGEIGPVVSTDVFQGDQRRGSVQFAFDERPGTWLPGDFLQQRWDAFQYHEVREIQSGPEQQLDISVRSRGNNVTYFRVNHTNVSPGAGLTQLSDYTATANVSLAPLSFEPTFLETGNLAGKSAGGVTQYFEQDVTEIDRPPMPLPAGFAYCGDGTGSFAGLSSLSFSETFTRQESEEAFHKRQVHAFVRQGLRVQRLLDDYNVDHSDLFPDLALYFLEARLGPSALIDYELLEEAAKFCDAQGFKFNGVVATPTNIRDFLNRVAPLNLLTVVQRGGNIGLRPSLPYNADGQIYVGPTLPRCLFDESNIVEGSFKMTFVPIAQRFPFVVEVLWRQQPEGNVGLIRATRVAFADAPDDAPVEQYDLSEFCTDHVHAVKVATVLLSRRRHVTHTLTLTTTPGSYAGALVPGDIVEVGLSRESSFDRPLAAQKVGLTRTIRDHHFYYQVNSVSTDRQGNVGLELTHWPVDEDGVSLVALDVANVDPGAVSIVDVGLPQPVEPGDPLFSEQFVSNYFTTLTFLPTQQINGYLRICVQASNPIANGDLVLTLQPIGYQLTILEGQTTGCVDVPIDGNLIDDLTDLDELDFDDLIIPDLDDLLATLDGLDGNTLIDDLGPQDLLDVLLDLTDLDDIFDLGFDLGDFSGEQGDLLMRLIALLAKYDDGASELLTIEQLLLGGLDGFTTDDLEEWEFLIDQLDLELLLDLTIEEIEALKADELILEVLGLDTGELGDLTVDDLTDLLNDLDLDDLIVDLDIEGLTGLDDLVVVDLGDGVFVDLNDLELDDITVGDVVAPDGYEIDGADLDADALGDLTPGQLGEIDTDINLNLGGGPGGLDELVPDENQCVGPTAGIYFHSIEFSDTTLIVKMRLSPNLPPPGNFQPLNVTIASGLVRATAGVNGPLVLPQPSNLPSLNFSGVVAYPDNTPTPGAIIQGEFQITYDAASFPAEATPGNPQIVYQMPISFASHTGGFCGVNYLNTAVAYFTPRPPGAAFIVICNYNSAKDDNFRIFYAGQNLGTCNFTPDGEQTAYLFIWSADPNKAALARAQVGEWWGENFAYRGTFTVTSSVPSGGSSASLVMSNVGRNNNGNRGTIIWGWIGDIGSMDSVDWTPDDGANFSATLAWPAPPVLP